MRCRAVTALVPPMTRCCGVPIPERGQSSDWGPWGQVSLQQHLQLQGGDTVAGLQVTMSPVFSMGEDVGVLSSKGYKYPQWWGLVGFCPSLLSQWGKIRPRESLLAPHCSWLKDRVTQVIRLLCFFMWLSLVFVFHRVSTASLLSPRTIFIGLFIVFVVFVCVWEMSIGTS